MILSIEHAIPWPHSSRMPNGKSRISQVNVLPMPVFVFSMDITKLGYKLKFEKFEIGHFSSSPPFHLFS